MLRVLNFTNWLFLQIPGLSKPPKAKPAADPPAAVSDIPPVSIASIPDFLDVDLLWKVGAITLLIALVLYFILFSGLRSWFRNFSSDLPIVTLNVSRIPFIILGVTLTISIPLSLAFKEVTAQNVNWGSIPLELFAVGLGVFSHIVTTVTVVTITYWLGILSTQVLVYFLKELAEQSEAVWDDVLVPILEKILPIIIYLVGGTIAIQALGIDLSGVWVAIGGATFVIGFALKDIIASFFSGLILLVDTPFLFGDVLSLPNGTRAIVKKIGLRVTNLHLIDTHSEMYIPNAALEKQQIVNLSRPTSHFYYKIEMPIKADVDPARAINIMESVVLAHPDTLGVIESKLEMLDKFYGTTGAKSKLQEKREAGRLRLLAEQQLNSQLRKVETELSLLSDKISLLEEGGLDPEELRAIQGDYVKCCEMIGLELRSEGTRNRKKQWLEESKSTSEDSLIYLLRKWYQCWLKDPDLMAEDHIVLPREWEQKVGLLRRKMNKLFKGIAGSWGDETRLDDQIDELITWLRESFKSSRNEWQDPKVWVDQIQLSGSSGKKNCTVKFFIDDITLEHCERGYRVLSEIRNDITWHLRQSYLSA